MLIHKYEYTSSDSRITQISINNQSTCLMEMTHVKSPAPWLQKFTGLPQKLLSILKRYYDLFAKNKITSSVISRVLAQYIMEFLGLKGVNGIGGFAFNYSQQLQLLEPIKLKT